MAKNDFTFTEADVAALTKAIKEQARLPKAKDAQTTFCEIWPKAKEALPLLQTFIGAIPGVGFFAKAAIGIVIVAGNAAEEAVCK
jgi:hypothetical protein